MSYLTSRTCTDMYCKNNCKEYSTTLSSCTRLDGISGYENLYGKINCERGYSLPQVQKGGYQLELYDSCTNKVTQQTIIGTGNCLKGSTSTSSVRIYCGENRTVVEEQYWYKSGCIGLPDQVIEYPYKLGGNCSNNYALKQCRPFFTRNDNFMGFWALPFASCLIVYLFFARFRALFGFLQIVTLQFKRAFETLYISYVFSIENIVTFIKYDFVTISRLLSSSIVSLNIGTFTAMGILLCIWYSNENVCPNDSNYISNSPLQTTFGFIIGFLFVLLFMRSLSFCFAFQESTGECDESETIFNSIGVFDGNSRYYFKNPLCPNSIKFTGDYGTYFMILVTIPMNIVSIIYSFYLFNHVNNTQSVCKSTRDVPLILAIIGLCNALLLALSIIFFFIIFSSIMISMFIRCIPKPKPKPLVKKEAKNETIPLVAKKDKNTEMLESLAQTRVVDWSREQLAFWLKLQSLGQYESKLAIFPMTVLADITENDLAENGVTDMIHQHSIYAAIKSLNFEMTFIYNPYDIKTWNSLQIEEFLTKLEISKPKELIQKYALNGALLKGIKESELQKLLNVPDTHIGNEKMKFISNAINENPRFYEKQGYQTWDKNQVSKLITTTMELPKYQKIFVSKGIFGALLPYINNLECFIELEIQEDHYKSFQTAIENIDEKFLSTSQVYDWCSKLQIVDSESLQNIKKYGIHGAMILSLDETELTHVFPIIGKNRMKRNAFLIQLDELRNKYKVKNPQRIQIERKNVSNSTELGTAPSISFIDKEFE